MDLFAQRARALAKSRPSESSSDFSSGAVPHIPLTGDLALASIPSVKLLLSHGLPHEADLKDFVRYVYDQSSSACVPFSTAAMMSIARYIDRREWITFNAAKCYTDLGGSLVSGMDAREVLRYSQKKGMLERGGFRRFRIGTYAWAQVHRDEGINAVKAAIAAHLPCVMALYMPTDYLETKTGDCTGEVDTGLYHQICVVGYDKKKFHFVDSQGEDWGTMGCGSLSFECVKDDRQKTFAYAYTAIDVIDESLCKLNWNWDEP